MLTETVCVVMSGSISSVSMQARRECACHSGWSTSYRGGGQEEEGAQAIDSVHACSLQGAIETVGEVVHGVSCWRVVVSWQTCSARWPRVESSIPPIDPDHDHIMVITTDGKIVMRDSRGAGRDQAQSVVSQADTTINRDPIRGNARMVALGDRHSKWSPSWSCPEWELAACRIRE